MDDPISTDRNSAGHTVSYTYDVASNKTLEQRTNDQDVNYDSYNAMNRLTQMTVHQGPTLDAVTNYTWTKAGKIATMSDPGHKTYSYDYDSQNRLITSTYPADSGGLARTETRTYDWAGNLATFKNRAGNVQTFQYDTRNRETSYSWNDGVTPSRTLTYDDASNILTCYQNTLLTRTYYADGLLKSELGHNYNYGDYEGTVSYTYDGDGRRASITYPSGKQYTYGYTPRDEARTIYEYGNSNYQAWYIYDPAGNRTTRNINAAQGHTTATYDTLNRITLAQHIFVGSTPKFNYGYDKVSNRNYEQHDGGKADGFEYDLNNQLTKFQRDGTLSGNRVISADVVTTLSYDARGDRTQVIEGTTTTNYGTANNLSQYPTVGGLDATYDANGNLKTYNTWTYVYDALNRLTAATSSSGSSASFWYDGFNRICTWHENGSGNGRFNVWDGGNLIEEYTLSDVLDTSYLHGAGSDELLSMTRAGQTYYFYQDGRGDTSQVTDSSGQLVETYRYDPFGAATVTVAPGKTATGTRFTFTGREYFPISGLYNYRNRFYLPGLGRFLQSDPIGFGGDGANLYRYCGNNPANRSDPSGLGEPKRYYWPWEGEHPAETERIIVNGTPLRDFDPNTSLVEGAHDWGYVAGVLQYLGGGDHGTPGNYRGRGDNGGSTARIKKLFYSPRYSRRFNRALAHVMGPMALLVPLQTPQNAPNLNTLANSAQLAALAHDPNYPAVSGYNFYDVGSNGTIFIPSDVLSYSNDFLVATYAHELANLISYQLTRNETTFGNGDDPLAQQDNDTGAAVEIAMFGHFVGH